MTAVQSPNKIRVDRNSKLGDGRKATRHFSNWPTEPAACEVGLRCGLRKSPGRGCRGAAQRDPPSARNFKRPRLHPTNPCEACMTYPVLPPTPTPHPRRQSFFPGRWIQVSLASRMSCRYVGGAGPGCSRTDLGVRRAAEGCFYTCSFGCFRRNFY